jgi:hypothetical protein
MPEYVIPPSFKKVLAAKRPRLQGAILECIARLGENPRHPSLQTHLARGVPGGGVFEAYVDRANRVTFHYDAGRIVLRNNCNHDILRKNP